MQTVRMRCGVDERGGHEGLAGLTKPEALRQCREVIDAMALTITQLRQQMALQQERLKLDSRISSKPPSSDGPASASRAQRRASQRKRGVQLGHHKGSFRATLDEPVVESIVDCAPPLVCECGAPVHADGKPVRHQVFDVPPIKPRINEYRLFSGRCTGCGKVHRAALPAGVLSGQIGPRTLALVGVLGTRYHLTQQIGRAICSRS